MLSSPASTVALLQAGTCWATILGLAEVWRSWGPGPVRTGFPGPADPILLLGPVALGQSSFWRGRLPSASNLPLLPQPCLRAQY